MPTKPTTPPKPRRRYAAPRVSAYGRLREVTRGGSGVMVEMMMMTATMRDPFP